MGVNTKKIGLLGENIAYRYLIKNGYRVLKRNYKSGFDEVDIIAIDINEILIFFEVKTITINNYRHEDLNGFLPEDNLTALKLKKITRACQRFLGGREYLINEEKGWRIDLIAIGITRNMTFNLRHYKNI